MCQTSFKHHLQITGALNRNVTRLFICTCCVCPFGTDRPVVPRDDSFLHNSLVDDVIHLTSAAHNTSQRVGRAWILSSHDVIWFPAPGTRHQNTTKTKRNMSLQAWGGLRILGEWDEPDAQETHPRGLFSETHSPARAFQRRSQLGGRRPPLQQGSVHVLCLCRMGLYLHFYPACGRQSV